VARKICQVQNQTDKLSGPPSFLHWYLLPEVKAAGT